MATVRTLVAAATAAAKSATPAPRHEHIPREFAPFSFLLSNAPSNNRHLATSVTAAALRRSTLPSSVARFLQAGAAAHLFLHPWPPPARLRDRRIQGSRPPPPPIADCLRHLQPTASSIHSRPSPPPPRWRDSGTVARLRLLQAGVAAPVGAEGGSRRRGSPCRSWRPPP